MSLKNKLGTQIKESTLRVGSKISLEILNSLTGGMVKKKKIESKPTETKIPIPREFFQKGIPYGTIQGFRKKYLCFPIDDTRHKIVMGATRYGKTEWAKMYVKNRGQGVCFISNDDGESIDDILRSLTEEQLKKTILLDHSDRAYPIGIGNFSANANIFEEDDIIRNWVDYFVTNFKIEEQYRTLKLLQNTLKAVFAANLPLYYIKKFIENEYFRSIILSKLNKNRYNNIIEFWYNFDEMSIKEKQFRTDSLMTRIGMLLDENYNKFSFGQDSKPLPYRKWMDEGYIVLIKCPKHAKLIIPLHVMGIWQAALSREDTPQSQRKSFMLICDEPQEWLGKNQDAIDNIFSKSGKYMLGLTCLFQSQKQIKKKSQTLLDIILDNRPDIILFNCENPPVDTKPHNVSALPKYHFVLKSGGHPFFAAKSLGRLKFIRDDITKFKRVQRKNWNTHYSQIQKQIERREKTWRGTDNLDKKSNSTENTSKRESDTGSPKEILKSSSSSNILR